MNIIYSKNELTRYEVDSVLIPANKVPVAWSTGTFQRPEDKTFMFRSKLYTASYFHDGSVCVIYKD